MVPKPDVCLVTTFCAGPARNLFTHLFPPILRPAIFDLIATDAGHVLVYFSKPMHAALEVLRAAATERFVVYGMADQTDRDNLRFRPFAKDQFLCDLASAKAVIASAGFSLMTESLYLRKPMLAVPVRGQFEQHLNAMLLANLGYGARCRQLESASLRSFLGRLDDYRASLLRYRREDNDKILQALAELLDDPEALRQRPVVSQRRWQDHRR